MTRLTSLMAGCVFVAMSGAAQADCAADLAALSADAEAPGTVSKDGTLAPLETEPAAGSVAEEEPTEGGADGGADAAASPPAETAATEGIAKDGSQAPLANAGAGVAMSGQDAQAQQAGEATAAEQGQGEGGSGRAAALERAHAALGAGDEAGCVSALEEARGL